MKSYDYKKFDAHWQAEWQKNKLYETPRLPGDKKVYVLDMFPYPSGDGLHVGHPKGYIATDIYSRFKRMNGYDVLHPMGWDAFGLPAEQYAIKNKVHPRVAVKKNVAMFKQQLSHLGLDYDWSREIDTTDPSFYKWTQWIFTKLYEKGLAYESNEPINWCPSCKTGLANEDLDGNKCERCESVVEKKPLRQWVLKITDYADRMIKDLDELNWPEGIKTAQKNWIGRSEGAEFDFNLVEAPQDSVRIFTTRADTLFGATFVAISAELAESWVKNGWAADNEVKNYIVTTLEEQKKENDYSHVPEKTGIFTGIYAINPANQEKIPVWVANYVIGGVGTGAIMAVPAHDERDYEFAKKYNIEIRDVISKKFVLSGEDEERKEVETLIRKVVDPILKDGDDNFYLIKEKEGNHLHFAGGGVDEGETDVEALRREIIEETGFTDFSITRKIQPQISCWGYRHTKGKNQRSVGPGYEVVLHSDAKIPSEIEEGKHELIKLPKDEVMSAITWPHHKYIFQKYLENETVFTEYGTLINSGVYSDLESEEAKEKIIEAFDGKKVVKYKIQDWVFARQRYWGEPFPVVRDENGKVYMVDESELPVLLPEVESYEPTGTGESPLATITDWVNVKGYITDKGTFKQSADGVMFTRETNTMPQWAGSSWYYLRFADPHNDKAIIDPEIEKAWQPVDVYVGGDHATRHLIYARFWHKFLFDIGVVSHSEPFTRLEFLGFILAEDGRKMSKRWGNIINPDDVVAEYGADTLRVYEMFMAPFEQTAMWSTSSIKGADKFLDRVYNLQKKNSAESTVQMELHKTIKKVTEDIESFKFNTAISQMMILVNSMEAGSFTKEDYANLLQVLAPFAPHLTEQIWQEIGNNQSIHTQNWPEYDEKKLLSKEVTISLQIGGKLRGTFVVPFGSTDAEVLKGAKSLEGYAKYVGEAEPKKVIVIPNRLINIVI